MMNKMALLRVLNVWLVGLLEALAKEVDLSPRLATTITANSIRVIKNNGAGLRGETASTSSQIQLQASRSIKWIKLPQ